MQELESSINFNHKNEAKRILERESKVTPIQLWNISTDGKTWNDVISKIKQQTLEHYKNQFANRPIGIHGKELPKFGEHKPDYWNEDGEQMEMSRNLFYQPDIYNPSTFYSGDPFKSHQKVDKKLQDLAPKPTSINPQEELTSKPHIIAKKPWTKENIVFIKKLVEEKLEAKCSTLKARTRSLTSKSSRRNAEVTVPNDRAPRLESLLRERGRSIIGARTKEARHLRSGGFVES